MQPFFFLFLFFRLLLFHVSFFGKGLSTGIYEIQFPLPPSRSPVSRSKPRHEYGIVYYFPGPAAKAHLIVR